MNELLADGLDKLILQFRGSGDTPPPPATPLHHPQTLNSPMTSTSNPSFLLMNPHPLLRRTRPPLLLRGLVLLAALNLAQPSLKAQEPSDSPNPRVTDPRAPIAVVIDFGSSSLKRPGKNGRKFEQVGIDPHRVVAVTVQYPVTMAGEAIIAESLDGGRVIVRGRDLIIDAQGLLSFGFQAGDLIGFSRLTLYNGETAQTLRFWVNDLSHPEENPKNTPGT